MSSPPPPPPPPPPSAPPPRVSPSPAWDRRTLREQRRAAKLAARQQRMVQQMHLRATRRNSVLGPAMLVGFGIVFLLIELGHVSSEAAFDWVSRWWPLVLLGAGFVLLAEWVADTRVARQRHEIAPPRTLGAGGVILLVLLTVAGLAAMGIRNSADWFRQNMTGEQADSWGLDQLFTQHTETDQELSAGLPTGALLTVQNFRGNISVSGSSPDHQVHVSVHQRLAAWRRDDLQARRRQDEPRLAANGSGLLLTAPGTERDRADLTIEVPHETAIDISPEKGDVSIEELRGAVNISDHSGNVTLTGLTGHVHITTRDDDAIITGHSLSGDVTLDGRSGDLAFSDITGPLLLHGDFFGTTHLERIGGPLHFQSSFTDFACAGIPGELTIEGRSEFQGEKLDGPITLATTDRNVSLSDVRRGLTLSDRNGSVTVALAEPLGPVKVNNEDGSIDLRLPEKASFALTAETADGQINNDLGLTSEHHDSHASLRAQVRKGGPSLALQTSEGDITIHRLSGPAPGDAASVQAAPPSRNEEEENDAESSSGQRLRRLPRAE